MELAIHNNIIVFAVSITKSAYAEGMNIASAKARFVLHTMLIKLYL